MRTGLKVARAVQLLGALMWVVAITKCSGGGLDGSGAVSGLLAGGLVAIVGARIYEFMTKE